MLCAGIYNLDNTDTLEDLEAYGLYFPRKGGIESLSIATSSGSTGYSWLVDRGSCRGVLDITNGFIFAQSKEDDNGGDL